MAQLTFASYNELRTLVHTRWDPIGIMDYGENMGEYDGYLPGLIQLLLKRPSNDEIFKYLWEIETVSIGLSGNKEKTKSFADLLGDVQLELQNS